MEVSMASVGDRVHVASRKLGQPAREGVVTGLSGRLVRVRWSTGEESTIVPGTGSVSIGGKPKFSLGRNSQSAKKTASAKRVPTSKAQASKKSSVASKKKSPAKRVAAAKTVKKAPAKKTAVKKAPSRGTPSKRARS
jgi:Domain of unknown function (DUF1918)